MAWLTVREAANILQISEAAVRKRAQRDTLRHMKGSDGHLYIYRDVEQALAESTGTKEPETSGGLGAVVKRVNISTILGSLAGIATLIYILGLFSLWAPIWRTYTHDIEMAWQAVSLVPRTVVIGLGVKQLIVLPLLVAIGVFAPALVLARYFKATQVRAYFLTCFWIIAIFSMLYAIWRVSAEISPSLGAPAWALSLLILTILISLYFFGILIAVILSDLYKFLRSKRNNDSESSESHKPPESSESDEGAGPTWQDRLGLALIGICTLLPGSLWLLIIGPRFPSEQLRTLIDVEFLVNTAAHIIAAAFVTFGGVGASSFCLLSNREGRTRKAPASSRL